ncbi:hypothetical protein REPUB_Repub17cG0163800 [Reevesia pubescens]
MTKYEEGSPPYASKVLRFFKSVGISDPNVENYSSKDFYSNLLCNHLKTHTVRRGHITCFATVKPAISNSFDGLHGGAVAAIAERVAIATARTVVGEDKEIFLGELGMSYLSAAPKHHLNTRNREKKPLPVRQGHDQCRRGSNITRVRR